MHPAGKHNHLLLKERLAAVCVASWAGEQKPAACRFEPSFLSETLHGRKTVICQCAVSLIARHSRAWLFIHLITCTLHAKC